VVVGSFPDICVADVELSIEFYRSLLGLDVLVDHGWYAELGAGGRTLVAFVQSGHETVPAITHTAPRGMLASFEVDDAAVAYAAATQLGCAVLVELVRELGQHHFMVTDPDGAVVDVIERVPLTNADLRRLVRHRRNHAVGSATCQ
jgi:catechol 2,3-dioxygenase-like lactoylglutathione lyase family enzyme